MIKLDRVLELLQDQESRKASISVTPAEFKALYADLQKEDTPMAKLYRFRPIADKETICMEFVDGEHKLTIIQETDPLAELVEIAKEVIEETKTA